MNQIIQQHIKMWVQDRTTVKQKNNWEAMHGIAVVDELSTAILDLHFQTLSKIEKKMSIKTPEGVQATITKTQTFFLIVPERTA